MYLMDLLPKSRLEREAEVRTKVAIGVVIGLTVGGLAGVLLAPKAGKETRDDLVKAFDELPGKAKDLSERAHKVVTDATGKIAAETHRIMCETETLPDLNEDILKGQWHQLKGGVKAKWGKLTDDDLTTVEGHSEKLMGILQTKYGYSKEKVKEEYDNFINANKKLQ